MTSADINCLKILLDDKDIEARGAIEGIKLFILNT